MARPAIGSSFVFWWRWLLTATCAVIIAGACLVFLPGFARNLFGVLYYGSATALDDFPDEAVRYITLAHGVLGAVMISWGVAFAFVLLGPFRQAQPNAWWTFSVSLATWFVVDSGFSLWTGFWQNAVLNAVIALFFLPALAGMRRSCTSATAPE
jgi:hypothetical protein